MFVFLFEVLYVGVKNLRVHNSNTSVGETIQVNKLLVLHKQNITTQTIKDTLEKL